MRTRKGDAVAAAAAAEAAPAPSPRAPKTVVTHRETRPAAARAAPPLPRAVRLPVLATMGLAISTVLHALAIEVGGAEVGRVARKAGGWGEVGAVVGWRT